MNQLMTNGLLMLKGPRITYAIKISAYPLMRYVLSLTGV